MATLLVSMVAIAGVGFLIVFFAKLCGDPCRKLVGLFVVARANEVPGNTYDWTTSSESGDSSESELEASSGRRVSRELLEMPRTLRNRRTFTRETRAR